MTTTNRPSASSLLALAFGAALFATACGANMAPVLNVQHVPVGAMPPSVEPTAFVHEAILRGTRSRGWSVANDVPGVVTAAIDHAGLQATVDIPYSATDYSIVYKSSSANFKYDGQRIHKHYNQWVDRLRASINQELSRTSAPPARAAAGYPAPPAAP